MYSPNLAPIQFVPLKETVYRKLLNAILSGKLPPGEIFTISELARQLGVSRAYVTMLVNGKRKASKEIVNKLHSLGVNNGLQSEEKSLRHGVLSKQPRGLKSGKDKMAAEGFEPATKGL